MPSQRVISLHSCPHPLDVLSAFRALPNPVLFHSAPGHADLGRYSFCSADPILVLRGSAEDWPAFRSRIRATLRSPLDHDNTLPPFQAGWAGWFSYEAGRAFDRMPVRSNPPGTIDEIALGLYDWVVAWDHLANAAWVISTGVDASGGRDATRARDRADSIMQLLEATPTASSGARPDLGTPDMEVLEQPSGLRHDFNRSEYTAAVESVVEHVLSGDLFQANLSQRFTAPFNGDSIQLLRAVHERAAAPMSAYLVHPPFTVVSASPERFLKLDPRTRRLESRPIKGTRPRHSDPGQDLRLADELLTSEKDRAENVMIVDLVRNDLSRVSDAGSVMVEALCRLETFPAVHHLVSVVSGTLRAGLDALDAFEAAFPGGSITGAPKLCAMEVIAALEPVRRDVYCGAIGWIGLDGGIDTSIAIRTITLDGTTASLHAGGGITAQSDPGDEYLETLTKARGLIAALADTA